MKESFIKQNSFIIIALFSAVGLLGSYFSVNTSINQSFIKYQVSSVDTTVADSIKIKYTKSVANYRLSDAKTESVVIQINNVVFNNNPTFFIWMALIVTMVTIASGAFPVFIIAMLALYNKFKLRSADVVFPACMALLITIVAILIQSDNKGAYKLISIFKDFQILFKPGRSSIPEIISICTIVLTTPIIMTVFMISLASNKLVKDNENLIKNLIKGHLTLSKLLLNSLQILALIIVFSILTTSSLALSIKNQILIHKKYFDIFPKEFSYLYGLLFSLFLAIVFIPVYIQMQYNAQALVEKSEQRQEEIEAGLLGKLKMETTAFDNLKILFTVISPLLSSIIPESLQLFK
ncbi:hypothetical protein ACFPMF_06515 [Larkinella bovis]|uniref:FtsX-like permease family protein n=1 Tax=Larkinella bovis TaxID=683041 RepID=A0ABW0IC97_9BACT